MRRFKQRVSGFIFFLPFFLFVGLTSCLFKDKVQEVGPTVPFEVLLEMNSNWELNLKIPHSRFAIVRISDQEKQEVVRHFDMKAESEIPRWEFEGLTPGHYEIRGTVYLCDKVSKTCSKQEVHAPVWVKEKSTRHAVYLSPVKD